jgi:N-acetylneuraminic acid mutarotase
MRIKKIHFMSIPLIIFAIITICITSCSENQTISRRHLSQTGDWETLSCTNAPTGRHENGFVECGGKFYLFGGRGIKPVEVFDPETNIWEQLRPTPLEMHHFQAVTIGDTIYVAGCMTGPYPEEPPVSNIYMYVPETDTWVKGPEIPENRQRGSSGAVVYDGKIYLAAGIQLGHTSGTVAWFDVFDPKTGEWTALDDAPHIRDHFHAVVVDGKLYCVGGRNTSYHTEDNFGAFFSAPVTAVDCYDFDSRTWTTLPNELPVGTAAGGIAHFGNTILYFGGESGQERAHSETQCLDLATGTWSFAAPMNRGRHGSASVKYENKLYIAAGSGNRGGGPELTSIEMFTPDSEWVSLFNGTNLDGWTVNCLPEDKSKAFWTVENGTITCNSLGQKDHDYVWLMSGEEYGDFELHLRFQAYRDSPGNSGVQVRSRYDAGVDAPRGGWLDGPQVDIDASTGWRSGLIYDETREEKRWISPSLTNWEIDDSYAPGEWKFKFSNDDDGWNDLHIICRGTKVKTILNGFVMTDYDGAGILDSPDHAAHNVGMNGHFALQLHSSDELLIRYKNIRVKKL